MPEIESPQPGRSVSELLAEIAAQKLSAQHDVQLYAQEFERLKLRVTRILQIGAHCAVFELCDGNILKLTNTQLWREEFGRRPFDLPVLLKRTWPRPFARSFVYFIQPRAEVPITAAQGAEFTSRLARQNYRLLQPCLNSVGMYRGRLMLLDPWAVCGLRPVSELLRERTDKDEREAHCIEEYAVAFEESPFRAWRVIAVGGESVVLELSDGNVLKIAGGKRLVDGMGTRSFDLPILVQGRQHERVVEPRRTRPAPSQRGRKRPAPIRGRGFLYFVQPMVETPVTEEQLWTFRDRVRKEGYRMTDIKADNLGIYQGQVVLIDPWAVEF